MSAYDDSSSESIYQHALKLIGKSLAEVADLPSDLGNLKNKGDLGQLVEKYYFGKQLNNESSPDFKEAGIELKTAGLILTDNGQYKVKERLVLSTINYEAIVNEKWDGSSFLKKCQRILVLFYHYVKEIAPENRKFLIKPIMYQIPNADLPIIRKDWEAIRAKVIDGKAHEISEGDTFYLGACRKGSGGVEESLRVQPFSDIKAKGRAFAFKASYVKKIIDEELEGHRSQSEEEADFHKVVLNKLAPFLDQDIYEISRRLNYFKTNPNHKSFHRHLANRMLQPDGKVKELEHAGIELKAIRLNRNGMPRESMSFPQFSFMEIIHENWEESKFFEKIESKFLLVIFGEDEEGVERLIKVSYWNMPYADREEARRVWEETQRRVLIDATNLPSSKESHVAHVRPKGRNGRDLEITPQGNLHLKQCFWLNKRYLAKVIQDL